MSLQNDDEIEIDNLILAIVAPPMAWETHHNPRRSREMWWRYQVIGDVTMTSIMISIVTNC